MFFTPQAGKSGDIKAIVQIQLAGTYVAFAQQLHQGGRQTTVVSASADSSADSGGGSDAGVGSGGRLEEQSAVGSDAGAGLSDRQLRVRFHIIRNAQIENVGKSQSCMVSKLRIIWKQTVVRLPRELGAARQFG